MLPEKGARLYPVVSVTLSLVTSSPVLDQCVCPGRRSASIYLVGLSSQFLC